MGVILPGLTRTEKCSGELAGMKPCVGPAQSQNDLREVLRNKSNSISITEGTEGGIPLDVTDASFLLLHVPESVCFMRIVILRVPSQ